MKKLLKEFKDFAIKGNMFDMAIGVVLGTAFNNIITSFVNDIIMPLFSSIFSNINLSDLKVILNNTDPENPIVLAYGNFIQIIINFLIIAISVFLAVKLINSFKPKEEPVKEEPKESDELVALHEIRDLLKDKVS